MDLWGIMVVVLLLVGSQVLTSQKASFLAYVSKTSNCGTIKAR